MVDPATGEFNRHDDKQPGCDFAFYGGVLACVAAFVHGKTREAIYRERAKIVANRHWNARNPEPSLCPDSPGTGDRYDAHHCFTTITGPYAAMLLRWSEYSGDPVFREMAVAYLRGYLKHGWDGEARRWRAMITGRRSA